MPKPRKASERNYKKQIWIVCEGAKTEPAYLKKFKQMCDLDRMVRVEIIPSEYTSARELVEVILDYKETDRDELWAVFDKDGYTKHHEAFTKAREHGVNIAFSSISFEYWLLLHFEYTTRAFAKSEEIERHLKKQKFLPKYDKGDANVFDTVKGLIQTAINNANKVRKYTAASGERKIYEANPYTNVDELLHAIEKLRLEYQKNPVFLFRY